MVLRLCGLSLKMVVSVEDDHFALLMSILLKGIRLLSIVLYAPGHHLDEGLTIT